jgi:hypothetical protein
VMRDGRSAQRHALRDLADIELCAREQLNEVLPHRIGQRNEQVAADGEVFAERADLWIERARVDQAAHVRPVNQLNALKHIDTLAVECVAVKPLGCWCGLVPLA